jgi:hypothetical protein
MAAVPKERKVTTVGTKPGIATVNSLDSGIGINCCRIASYKAARSPSGMDSSDASPANFVAGE